MVRLCALFAEDLDSVSVGELRSHKLWGMAKKKKDFNFRIVALSALVPGTIVVSGASYLSRQLQMMVITSVWSA